MRSVVCPRCKTSRFTIGYLIRNLRDPTGKGLIVFIWCARCGWNDPLPY